MKIYSIEWHEKNLKHMGEYLEQEKRKIEELKTAYLRSELSYIFLGKQIEIAKKEGKKSFHPDKYLVKRVKK